MHRTALNTAIALIVLACLILNSCHQPSLNQPSQNQYKEASQKLIPKRQLSPQSKAIKKEWFELIHRAKEGVDWRSIEYQNAMDKIERKKESFDAGDSREMGTVELADGKLIGTWQELGPTNLAGDVKRAVYRESEDRIYAISAGKTLWRGKLDGSEWEVVVDDLLFDHHILEIVTLEDGSDLIFASMDEHLFYSADGNLWSEVGGFGSLSEVKHMKVMENGEVFILSKPSQNSFVNLYKSTITNGQLDPKNYIEKFKFFILDMDDIAIATDTKQENLYALKYDNANKIIYTYFYDTDLDTLIETSAYETNLIFNYPSDEARFYVSTREFAEETYIKLTRIGRFNETYISESKFNDKNFGESWVAADEVMLESPWFDAYTILDDQETHIMGREECYYSIAGSEWQIVNPWREYYIEPENKLHIDIMQIREFKKDNQPFTLICTHGGIYYTEDITQGVKNITLDGMNNAQFYDVITIPSDGIATNLNWIIAGSQDQGWQRGRIESEEPPIVFEQMLAGDYGHLTLDEDLGIWMSYPDGEVRHYPYVLSPFNFIESDSNQWFADINYKVPRSQEQVWISPIMIHPDPAFDNTLLVAGGGINENQEGSYLIRIKKISDDAVEEFQYDQDFSFLDGEISAMEYDPNDFNKWYIATTSGQFYFTNDAGASWIKTSPTVPGIGGANEIYGTDILVSKKTPGTLYVSGSGYSNAPVFRSTDGGFTFTPFDNGLKGTTVFELDQNEKESLIFAATEMGPYVYLKATGKWYPMDGNKAPTQAYWSVDYMDEIETARYGTYGRGVWQFEINSFTANKNLANISEQVTIYPNPTAESLRIQTEFFGNISHYEVLTLAGNFIFGGEITTPQDISIPVAQLAQGAYFLRLRHKDGYIFKKFVKI